MVTLERKMMGDVLVLTPHKNLIGGDESNELLAAITEFASAQAAKVVVDLGEIKWVSSLGIGLLRRANLDCERSGGWLHLARVGAIVEKTLLSTGLIIYFDSFETVAEAVAAPKSEARPRSFGDAQKGHPKRPGV
jgi:anti-anti-sigma factor